MLANRSAVRGSKQTDISEHERTQNDHGRTGCVREQAYKPDNHRRRTHTNRNAHKRTQPIEQECSRNDWTVPQSILNIRFLDTSDNKQTWCVCKQAPTLAELITEHKRTRTNTTCSRTDRWASRTNPPTKMDPDILRPGIPPNHAYDPVVQYAHPTCDASRTTISYANSFRNPIIHHTMMSMLQAALTSQNRLNQID